MLTLITPPSELPVTLAEAKLHLRLNDGDPTEDSLVSTLIGAATAALDGPEGLLGRALMAQTWQMNLDRFPPVITLPLPPCQAVTAITYRTGAGTIATLDPDFYEVAGLNGTSAAAVRPRGWVWSSFGCGAGGVSVRFVAGWSGAVPEPIRQAILMHVAALYENREGWQVSSLGTMPLGYADLIRPWRCWSF